MSGQRQVLRTKGQASTYRIERFRHDYDEDEYLKEYRYIEEMERMEEEREFEEMKMKHQELGVFAQKRMYHQVGKVNGIDLPDLEEDDIKRLADLGYSEEELNKFIEYEGLQYDPEFFEGRGYHQWYEWFRNHKTCPEPIPPTNPIELFFWKKGKKDAFDNEERCSPKDLIETDPSEDFTPPLLVRQRAVAINEDDE